MARPTEKRRTSGRSVGARRAAYLALVAVCLTLAGCGEPEPKPYPPRQPTPGVAVLPPTPDLHPPQPPAQYEDGAWSVAGLLGSGSAGRGAEPVQVRGYVAAIKPCPDVTKGCSPAPHYLLTDREDLQGKRLLVGGDFDAARDGIVEGKLTTARGLLRTGSPDGQYFAPSGMLLLAPPAPDADAKP